MADSDKTVFISYRRDVSFFIARAVFEDLRANGYDVFFDMESINAGEFEQVILNQIAARVHFVVILTKGSVKRCAESDDWLRREIEHAIEMQRNIVPLLVNDFAFKSNRKYLTGKLSRLEGFNGVEVPQNYFDEAMRRLRERFLKVPEVKVIPTTTAEQPIVEQKIAEAANQPVPTQQELSAEQYLDEGYAQQQAGELQAAIAAYDQAIALNPTYVKAHYNRGLARYYLNNLQGALEDYSRALELDPNYAKPYNNRGLVRAALGDLQGALSDYDQAVLLRPDNPITYNNRANALTALGQTERAIADYEHYLKLGGGEQFKNRRAIERLIADLRRQQSGAAEKDVKPSDKVSALMRRLQYAAPSKPQELVDDSIMFKPETRDDLSKSAGSLLAKLGKSANIPEPATSPRRVGRDQLDKTDEESEQVLPHDIPDGITRPLPPPSAFDVAGSGQISFGQATDVGLVRSSNQDAIYSFFSANRSQAQMPDFGVFIVADGMGGHQEGEKASSTAVQIVGKRLITEVYLPLMQGLASEEERPTITETLISGIQKANVEIIAQTPDAGTTLTAAVLVGDLVHIAHVGETRAYLLTRDGMEQITRDHSVTQRLLELELITPEEVNDHPQRDVLYRALGQNEAVEVDTLTRRLPPGSHLLLCSDGLSRLVSDDKMQTIIRNYPHPQEACDQLIALANTYAGHDNISVIVVKIP